MSATDEQQRVSSARSGNREAYAELVRAYHVKVLGLCRTYLGDLASAEDAAQEAFVKAFVSLKKYRGDSAFGTWLYRITANHCKDVLRSSHRRKTDSLDAMIDDRHVDVPDGATLEQTASENKDMAQRLLNGLGDDYRVVLSLREISGLSYQEIASALHISVDAVKARLKRARHEAIELARHFLQSPTV
jgi:RNA polymerase sigma-70 factor (ECF subfamily)